MSCVTLRHRRVNYKMKAIVLVLLVVLAITSSQAQICMSPPQWEGLLFEYVSRDESSVPTTIHIGKESYDATEQRRRFAEEIDVSRSYKEYYDQLYLYKERVGYSLNVKTRECNKFEIHEPWSPIDVPANVTLEATYYLGSENVPGNYVRMNAYHGNTKQGYYRGSWTADDCIPYIQSYFSTNPIPHYHRMTRMDVTVGISDPNVFTPPKECQEL